MSADKVTISKKWLERQLSFWYTGMLVLGLIVGAFIGYHFGCGR